ncbi:ATP-binding cassette domain-containing protein [Eubacteriales bacterium KG127]
MLKLKNLSKFYYSKGIIASGISRINLELYPGEFVVITGESGSGKSTLINVISGLDSYEDGEMYIDGNETSHYTVNDFEEYRRSYIANIFQSFNLVSSYTVFQNVELVLLVEGKKKSEVKDKVDAIIDKVGLASFRNQKVSKLSGGQKQRVAIARALAKDTPIIVADEPTGNLDSKSAKGIVELLKEVSKDHLVIVVTHNYDQFEDCATRRVKLSDGRIIEDEILKQAKEDSKISAVVTKPMSLANKLLLGIRNTFNIIPKFVLLLIVFLFLTGSVITQYAGIKANNDAFDAWGKNQFFSNNSDRRIIVKHKDSTALTEEDYKKFEKIPHFKTLFKDDIILDTTLNSVAAEGDVKDGNEEKREISIDAYPSSWDEMPSKITYGEKPASGNQAVLGVYSNVVGEEEAKAQIGKELKIMDNSGKEYKVIVTGIYFIDRQKKQEGTVEINFTGTGKIFLTDELLTAVRTSAISDVSQTSGLINGRKYLLTAGAGQFRIKPNENVARGYATVPEEIDALYESGSSKWKKIDLHVKNIYFEETGQVTSLNTYTKKNYQKLLGITEPFEDISGNIYINPEDYNALYMKDNYQATVYINDRKGVDESISWLEKNGYKVLSLAKAKKQIVDTTILNIVVVPINLGIMIGIFFICYFVIRLILRSRSTYFSTLRLLCLDMRSIKQILDIELIFIIHVAYGILIGFIQLVLNDVITIKSLKNTFSFLAFYDYIVMYVIVVLLAYIISRKFSKKLFKKSAMSTFREEV